MERTLSQLPISRRSPVFRALRGAAFALLALLAAIPAASAQEVLSQLSSSRTNVGEPVQLIVTVKGARGADLPQNLSVNGLRINLVGRQTQFQMGTGMKPTSTLIFTYLVVPQFEGNFTIAPFDVSIQGRVFRTQPMQLSVGGPAQAVPPQAMPGVPGQIPQTSPPNGDARPYFGELVLSKKKAYVGEVIPAELRFYFNTRIGGQVGDRPAFAGDGFTVQKFSNASKREQVIDGENYVVFSFQTSITAVKAGTLEIPSAQLEARLQLPGNDPGGVQDFFGGMLPPGMFAEMREVTIETRPQNLEVLALPKEGRPEDFTGAIGRFTMEAGVSPKKAAAGEPVTLTATVTGRGNLEAMGAPSLTGDENWRSYPPSDKITAEDAISYNGSKVFEFPLIARTDQTATPGLRFSYFDPTTGKYETLFQEPLPVDARAGTSAPASTPAADQSATPVPGPGSSPSAPNAAPLPAAPSAPGNWTSLLLRKEFLIANLALAIAWLALATFFALRRFAGSAAGARAARRRQARELLGKAKSASPETFFDAAIAYLCAKLDCDVLTAPQRIDALGLPADVHAGLHRILERQAESRYAAGGQRPASADERETLQKCLNELDARHAS